MLYLVGPFYAFVCCSLRAAYSILTLYRMCEYLLPQKLKIFYALFTFYFTFVRFLTQFNIAVTPADRAEPLIKIGILIAGASASWLLTNQVVARIWKSMLQRARGTGERSEG